MTKSYDYKIIISGQHIEKYEYLDKNVRRGYERKVREKKKINSEFIGLKKQTEFTKSSLNRTRTVLRRLVNTNYHLNKFVTLTFGSEMHDQKKANYIFNLFTQRMKHRFPEFQYIAVPEFQPVSQRVHFHLLCNLRYVPNKQIAEIWGQGFVKINRIDKLTNVGAYVCKYLTKEMCDKRLFHKKKFFCSTTLNSPSELTGYPALKYFNEFVKGNIPVYEKEFKNEYLGRVSYEAYSLDFIPPLPKIETPYDRTILLLKKHGLIPLDFIG